MNNVNELVQQIHNEFDTASEEFLKNVKAIISVDIQPSAKAKRLIALGFNASKPVRDYEALKQAQRDAGIVKDCVEHYAVAFPGYKFISHKDVEKICNKYNLLCGDSKYFIGEIPEKNVQEMEMFLSKHKPASQYQRSPSGAGIMFETLDGINYFWLDESEEAVYGITGPFKICAPQSNFDTTYLSVNGHMLQPAEVDDPIVLQPVKFGYLIVTKWGPEASDPIVINQALN